MLPLPVASSMVVSSDDLRLGWSGEAAARADAAGADIPLVRSKRRYVPSGLSYSSVSAAVEQAPTLAPH